MNQDPLQTIHSALNNMQKYLKDINNQMINNRQYFNDLEKYISSKEVADLKRLMEELQTFTTKDHMIDNFNRLSVITTQTADISQIIYDKIVDLYYGEVSTNRNELHELRELTDTINDNLQSIKHNTLNNKLAEMSSQQKGQLKKASESVNENQDINKSANTSLVSGTGSTAQTNWQISSEAEKNDQNKGESQKVSVNIDNTNPVDPDIDFMEKIADIITYNLASINTSMINKIELAKSILELTTITKQIEQAVSTNKIEELIHNSINILNKLAKFINIQLDKSLSETLLNNYGKMEKVLLNEWQKQRDNQNTAPENSMHLYSAINAFMKSKIEFLVSTNQFDQLVNMTNAIKNRNDTHLQRSFHTTLGNLKTKLSENLTTSNFERISQINECLKKFPSTAPLKSVDQKQHRTPSEGL